MNELKQTLTERRRQTRNRVYRCIFSADEPVSKQEIAGGLGLSLPTVHQNITELMEAGLVRDGERKMSTGGRPPMGYEADERVRFAAGILLTADRADFLAADLKQQPIARKTVALPKGPDGITGELLKEELSRFFAEQELDESRLLGVGVSVPAAADMENGKTGPSAVPLLGDLSVRSLMRAFPWKVQVETAGSSGGRAEWLAEQRRHPEQPEDFVFLSLDNEVGGSVFFGGKPYQGIHRRSAEFGHLCVEPRGLRCRCGRKGCLEAYCSTLRIGERIGTTPDRFFKALTNGENAKYAALWLDLLNHLAIGIHNIHMAFDCRIVLGGRLTEYLMPYMNELRDLVSELDPFSEDTDYLAAAQNPGEGALVGVTWYFISDFLDSI